MIGGGMSENRGYSAEVAKAIDEEVAKIIEDGKSTAKEILTKYRPALEAISMRLVEVETMEREEYEALLKQQGVEIKDAYEEMYGEKRQGADPSKVVADTKVDSK
jgi:cell division protease FtsH